VQAAGHIRRGQQQREDRTRLALRRRGHGEKLFFDPVLGPARLNRARLVRFGQFVRHGWVLSADQLAAKILTTGDTGVHRVDLRFLSGPLCPRG
jgi:hypothetical protein